MLTNRNTASAGEMLAMALRDNHKATIVGERTAGVLFGKDFEDIGSGRLLVFRSEPTILSPTGQDYSDIGVPPDILVPDAGGFGEDLVLRRAIELSRDQTGNPAEERTR